METYLREHAKLQLLSIKFEKKMHAEGFDSTRNGFNAWFTSVETFQSFVLQQSPFEPECRIYGSTGEGIVYPPLSRSIKDMDLVIICRANVAVETVCDAIQYYTGNGIYLIENEPSLPGYCCLRMIKENPFSGFPNPVLPMTSEVRGLQYLSCSAIKNFQQKCMSNYGMPSQLLSCFRDLDPNMRCGEMKQQGPATSFDFKSSFPHLMNMAKVDSVIVIRCPKWPSCASEWIERRRKYNLPSTNLIREIVAKGIYFAPVGSKSNQRKDLPQLNDLHWRYSFNEAERRLVQSFNTIQAKCYALLKRVVSEIVTPQFENGEDVISSYHIKTLMFWTIEETDPQVWIPANLIQCVFLVLNRLVQCVESGNCPSYFMPDENLLLFKVSPEKKEEVLTCIKRITEEGWTVLTRLSNFAIDHDFIRNLQEEEDTHQNTPAENIYDPGDYELNVHDLVESLMLPYYLGQADVCKIHESDTICSEFNDVLNHLILGANACNDTSAKESMKNIIAKVCSSYGTNCLSLSRRPTVERLQSGEIEDLGQRYIELSCLRKQVECLAKHANYAYMRGNHQSTLSTSNYIIRMHLNHSVNTFSAYASLDVQIQTLENSVVNTSMKTDASSEMYALINSIPFGRAVIFMKNEIYAVPGNAKIEMFMVEYVSDPWNPLSRFIQCFVVDPYLYVTYLVFLTYSDMRLQEEADKAITMMEHMCSVPPNSLLPTSLNLLSDCYLKRGKVDKAMDKFALSMQRNSRRNAAPWHVARLVWRKLLDRRLQTSDGDD